ncbi:MAG: hypothetical protein ABR512_00465 [Desulfopila sp.]
MTAPSRRTYRTSYFFIFLLVSGSALFLYSLYQGDWQNYWGELQRIAVGIIVIGIGEWINHPRQESVEYTDDQHSSFHHFYHRKRNPSSLGNLFVIGGLICIFMGLAQYF